MQQQGARTAMKEKRSAQNVSRMQRMCNVHPGMFIDEFKSMGKKWKRTPEHDPTLFLCSVQPFIVSMLYSKGFFLSYFEKCFTL